MYRYVLAKAVKKFLKKRSKKFLLNFQEKIHILKKDPFDSQLDVVRLLGKERKYRLRIGKYRLLFEIIHDEILIYFYQVDSRGDVYKK